MALSADADRETRTPPETRGDYALLSIREDLVTGRLVSGVRVTAEELAARLGISHVPVREALRYLEAEGHFERDHRGRLRVRPTSPDEAVEIYDLRRLLETAILAVAVPNLTDADMVSMDAQFAAMEAGLARRDIEAYATANRGFHFIAFERAERPWMLRFLRMVWDAAARYQTRVFSSTGWEERLQAEHRDLLEACRRKDAASAIATMDVHRSLAVEEAHRGLREPV